MCASAVYGTPSFLSHIQALRTWLLSLCPYGTNLYGSIPTLPQPEFSPHGIIEAVVIDLETDFLGYMLHGIVLGQYVPKDDFDPFVPAYLNQA